MTGQDAVNSAKAFNEVINYDGVVLTKLDGDTRGGAALSVKYTVGKPIKFVSTGETLDTLDVFHPDRMAQRILGMGDIVSLVEKAQEQFDEKEAARLEEKVRKIDNSAFGKVEAIIFSMTPHERANPEVLNYSRKQRIAKGCGKTIHEINMFVKQFNQMKNMMHKISKGGMPNMGAIGPDGSMGMAKSRNRAQRLKKRKKKRR